MTKQELDAEYDSLAVEQQALTEEQARLEQTPHDIAGHEEHRRQLHAHISRLHHFVSELRAWQRGLQQ
jgi:hypothetical protein